MASCERKIGEVSASTSSKEKGREGGDSTDLAELPDLPPRLAFYASFNVLIETREDPSEVDFVVRRPLVGGLEGIAHRRCRRGGEPDDRKLI